MESCTIGIKRYFPLEISKYIYIYENCIYVYITRNVIYISSRRGYNTWIGKNERYFVFVMEQDRLVACFAREVAVHDQRRRPILNRQ